jgi:hypothetical protein
MVLPEMEEMDLSGMPRNLRLAAKNKKTITAITDKDKIITNRVQRGNIALFSAIAGVGG